MLITKQHSYIILQAQRDGITDVKLSGEPFETDKGYYAVDYISDGKRGTKHFVTRICIQDQMLYVLTAQSKEENFNDYQKEIFETVGTFEVIGII